MYKGFHKLIPLAFQDKSSISSSNKYNTKNYVVLARTRRRQFLITIKCVTLWNSLHNFL